jgi:hypothetical protein
LDSFSTRLSFNTMLSLVTLLSLMSFAETQGAAAAPAALPPASNAWNLWLGAPEISLGYRQGFSLFELEARATFDYFQAAGAAEGAARLRLFEKENFLLAPFVGLGLAASSGATYLDEHNHRHFSFQPRFGLWATYAFTPHFSGIALFDFPIRVSFLGNSFGLKPTTGAGAEFSLGNQLSVLLMAGLGPEWIKQPSSSSVSCRLAWYVRFGIGFRIT